VAVCSGPWKRGEALASGSPPLAPELPPRKLSAVAVACGVLAGKLTEERFSCCILVLYSLLLSRGQEGNTNVHASYCYLYKAQCSNKA